MKKRKIFTADVLAVFFLCQRRPTSSAGSACRPLPVSRIKKKGLQPARVKALCFAEDFFSGMGYFFAGAAAAGSSSFMPMSFLAIFFFLSKSVSTVNMNRCVWGAPAPCQVPAP